MSISITPHKTRLFQPPKDDLTQLLDESLTTVKNKTVVAVSSKIISIAEGQCIPVKEVANKDNLIKDEADFYLEREQTPGKWVMHTIKNNILIPTAGIDASNANGHYILWPRDPYKSAKEIWQHLTTTHNLSELGIVITDSRSTPLRRGVSGVSLAHWGFKPLIDYRGTNDLFGKKMTVSQTNIPDGIASMAILAMGEGTEMTPLVTISGMNTIIFEDEPSPNDSPFSSFEVSSKEDLFAPLLQPVPWKSKK